MEHRPCRWRHIRPSLMQVVTPWSSLGGALSTTVSTTCPFFTSPPCDGNPGTPAKVECQGLPKHVADEELFCHLPLHIISFQSLPAPLHPGPAWRTLRRPKHGRGTWRSGCRHITCLSTAAWGQIQKGKARHMLDVSMMHGPTTSRRKPGSSRILTRLRGKWEGGGGQKCGPPQLLC